MWWIIIGVLLGITMIIDAKKRKSKILLPVLSFLLWPITLPIYLATRNLKEKEVREGGTGWNILKNFALYWTGACIYWGASSMLAVSEITTTSDYDATSVAIGAGLGIIMIGGIWFAVTVGVLVIGLFIKQSSMIEKGPTGELSKV